MKALVAGAGGFIGGHLTKSLLNNGFDVVAADIKPLNFWYQVDSRAENVSSIDLKHYENCLKVTKKCDHAYNLAADMGGMGFIANNKVECMESVLVSTNLINTSYNTGVDKFFYASSACIYPGYRQEQPDLVALKESDAYPADPEDGYGWEKLFSERLAYHYWEDKGFNTYTYRFHNVYGPYGTYDGGREKAPAAICRKVIEAKMSGNFQIEIWGDGEQTRSFMYIDDCIHGIDLLMKSDHHSPLNLGSSELVTINQLVSIAEDIAGVSLRRVYDPSKPQGVRGRNSDNSLIKKTFDWEPSTKLQIGMEATFKWIFDQMQKI